MNSYPHINIPLFEPEAAKVTDSWRACPRTAERHRRELDRILTSVRLPELRLGGGMKILTVGGGIYWPGIVILARLLREKLDCRLPVEIWHREDEKVEPEDLAHLDGITYHNITEIAKSLGDARIIRGWESKHYALTHTDADKVLFLDADAYCVSDPTKYLDQCQNFWFWQDLPNTAAHVKWDRCRIDNSANVPCIQGGQLFIDRDQFAETLLVSHWMNQHSDFYYGCGYGDQDTWRMALAATGQPYVNLGPAGWRHPAFDCRIADESVVVHRCRGKFFRPGDTPRKSTNDPKPNLALPREQEVLKIFTELMNKGKSRDSVEVFRKVYIENLWNGGSGAGSTWAEAKPYVQTVNAMLSLLGGQSRLSVLDVGCGDGRVAATVAPGTLYHGVDVFPACIDRCRELRPDGVFDLFDVTGAGKLRGKAAGFDVLLCKDVLHHWPSDMVSTFVDEACQIVASGRTKLVVLAQDVHQEYDGQDTYLGGYRALHPHMEPLASIFKRYNDRVKVSVIEYLHKAMLVLTKV